MKPWYVYVMQSTANRRKVYTGATNDPAHRVRAHKGEIKGGARTTTRWGEGNAEMVILVGPFPDTGSIPSKIAALSFEKKMKIVKCGGGLDGRVKTLIKLLHTPGGHVTKNVNLNKYSLDVRTRLSRVDFVTRLATSDDVLLAYATPIIYDVKTLGEAPAASVPVATQSLDLPFGNVASKAAKKKSVPDPNQVSIKDFFKGR